MRTHLDRKAPDGRERGWSRALRWLAGRAAAASCAFGLLAVPGLARAQTQAPPDTAEPDERLAVMERPRPAFEAPGIQIGAFTFFPKMTVTPTYDDNIFATPTSRVGDEIFLFRPELNVQAVGGYNTFNSYARLVGSKYVHNDGESTLDAAVGASDNARLSDAFTLRGGLDADRTTEARSSTNTPRDTVSPIQYNHAHLLAGLGWGGDRINIDGQLNVDRFSYNNGRTPTGAVVFQGDRNRNLIQGDVKLGHTFRSVVNTFVYVSGNDRLYDLRPPAVPLDRTSHGFDTGLGLGFNLTHLLRGQLEVGYLTQYYKSRSFSKVHGAAAHAQVVWLLTKLTTLTFNADRSVQDAEDPLASSFVTSSGGISIDHELLRNLILNTKFNYFYDRYEGVQRNDNHYQLDARATYLLNRNVGISLKYTRVNELSLGLASIPDFTVNTVSLSFVYQR